MGQPRSVGRGPNSAVARVPPPEVREGGGHRHPEPGGGGLLRPGAAGPGLDVTRRPWFGGLVFWGGSLLGG